MEERKRPGVERVYENDRIRVTWEPSLCIKQGECYGGLPEVFRPRERPWVRVDTADADDIARVVKACPTGALHFERIDGGAQEEAGSEVAVEPQPDGPLFLRGAVRVHDEDGELIRTDTRVALCRCGMSENKPFCDGSHRGGFQSRARPGPSPP